MRNRRFLVGASLLAIRTPTPSEARPSPLLPLISRRHRSPESGTPSFRPPAPLRPAALFSVTALPPSLVLAHAEPIAPEHWLRVWSFEPGVIASLFLTAALYVAGLHWLRHATHSPRKLRSEAFYFWAGFLLLVVALVSPVHPLGQALFSAHMVQHELLMVAAAPLLVLGRPGLVILWALPRSQARAIAGTVRRACDRRLGHWLLHPATAWSAHALALWVWHVPRFFQATLGHEWIHALQHTCFLGSAVWFWHAVFYGPARRAGYGMSVIYLFTTALHSGALGALITFATTPWYPEYGASAAQWGFTGVEDQQLGGLIMWVPAGLTYIVAALALFAAWMRESDSRMRSLPSAVGHQHSPAGS